MKADAYNAQTGSLPDADCHKCLNKGFIAYVNTIMQPDNKETTIMTTRICECWKEREFNRNLKNSGLEDLADRCTFDSFRVEQQWQSQAKQTALNFLKETGGEWFFAAGNPGSGKTHLCTALAVELMRQGKQIQYMLWRDDGSAIKATVNDTERYQKLIRPLKQAQVLYIDDFLKTKKGADIREGDINLAFELINSRYNDRGKITIISTEKTARELVAIDEAIGTRIVERSKKFSIEFSGIDKNQRLKI